MTVRVDHADHGPFTQVLVSERQSRPGRFAGGQRVDHDPSCLAPNQCHVGDVEAANLVDPVYHLKQAMVQGVELRLTPQAGIDGIRRSTLQEPGGGEVIHRLVVAVVIDGRCVQGGNEPSPCGLEGLLVLKVQAFANRSIGVQGPPGRRLRCSFGFWQWVIVAHGNLRSEG